jgi:hypothetical protein
MKEAIKRAPFHNTGEFIVKEEMVSRPVVTVLRDNNCFARKEQDLIVCGCCGSLNNYKKKYCGGCGAKFKRVTLEELKKLDAEVKKQEESDINKNQLNLFDYVEGAKE